VSKPNVVRAYVDDAAHYSESQKIYVDVQNATTWVDNGLILTAIEIRVYP
jgi:hypothetical protein